MGQVKRIGGSILVREAYAKITKDCIFDKGARPARPPMWLRLCILYHLNTMLNVKCFWEANIINNFAILILFNSLTLISLKDSLERLLN